MGQIKNQFVKSMARTLVEKYPDRFSTDFEKNKQEIDNIILLESKTIRNKVAGYLVHEIRKKNMPKKEYQPKIENKRRRPRRRKK